MNEREQTQGHAFVRIRDRARGWLREASRTTLDNGARVADEGDRWFIAAVRTLDGGAQRAERGFDLVAGALFARLARLRPSFTHRRTARERIEALLHREGRRLDFDVGQEEFRAFAEKIATLFELVFTGAIRLDDIAFEHAPGEDEQEPSLEPLAQPREEMSEPQKRDEGDDGQPMDWQEELAP